ncbi:uncharacterized protein LOC129599065 [Paramacrobiotus metropolitanus]|uniref:uncharacterized protein LOC129599065 n=1 Tax=Paramacrobiotus metropolitanus TaxID=2943436 RepID=UPI0024459465|nr:uncharacterized protein LOC129599065 [Paramacrobiotus metropolitanus]
MLIFKEDVTAWNAVDVLVDGLLQHGRVVNVAEGGLIVDFGSAARRAEFVQYGNIFHAKCRDSWKDDVLVLLRSHPNDVWKWYPGKVVSLGDYDNYDGAECVDVQLPHGTVRELVREAQLRLPPTDKDLAGAEHVKPGDFIIRSCQLPGANWSGMLGEIFKCQLNASIHNAVCTSLQAGSFLYLQRPTDRLLKTKDMKPLYDSAWKENDRGCSLSTQEWIRRHGTLSTPQEKRTSGKGRSLPLPVALLVEVFQSLDSIERIRCRRVCSLWNHLLTTETNFPDVRVDGRQASFYNAEFNGADVYWVVSCLLKCLNSAAKMTVIVQLKSADCARLAALIRHLLGEQRLPTLVFCECLFGESYDETMEQLANGVVVMAQSFVSYDRMVLKNCMVFDCVLLGILVTQHSFRIQSSEAMRMEVWDVVENGLNVRDRQALVERIADGFKNKRNEQIDRNIVNALNYYQSVDPRPATEYRGRKWTAASISDLDVSKLTALTAVAFIQSMRFREGESDF